MPSIADGIRLGLNELPGSILKLGSKVTPHAVRGQIAHAVDRLTDLAERLLHRWDILTPPVRIRLRAGPFLDARVYRRSAELNLKALCDLSGLKPDFSVLDIGCGSGRMASALTTYLNAAGVYEGFDLGVEAVAWCQNRITAQFPNFRFQALDVFSKRYNPSGSQVDEQLRFPYPDARFDMAFASSVYTHMLPDAIAHYVHETGRVLKPGGMNLASFCLLNDHSLGVVRRGTSSPPLVHDLGDSRIRDPDDPASFVAIREDVARHAFDEAGFEIVEPIIFGSWASGAARDELDEKYGFNQDLIIARKVHD